MKASSSPDRETQRMAAVLALGVLDTPRERPYDALTRLAALSLHAPTSLLALVDDDRAWFKSTFGFAQPSLPREVSFCNHVVAGDAVLAVADARADRRFATNPLVTAEPYIRFYAGAPLHNAKGDVLGALCVLGAEPRVASAEEIETLTLLAEQASELLVRSGAARQLRGERDAAERSSQRASDVIRALSHGVVVHDGSGQVVAANPAAAEILGVDLGDFLAHRLGDDMIRVLRADGSDYPTDDFPVAISLRTGRTMRDEIMGIKKLDGRVTWLSVSVDPRTSDAGQREVVATFHDITALRETSLKDWTRERLSTTKTFAAGVGHEINNPLVYVLGNTDFALELLHKHYAEAPSDQSQDVLDALGEVREGAERIRRIVRGLHVLSREEIELAPVDLAWALRTAVDVTMHDLEPRATLSLPGDSMPPVLADPSTLTQVLTNLLMNAMQAFEADDPATNRIDVTTARTTDGRVRLVVHDNGPGMSADVQSHAFDPFFTTKPVGAGTGLGLTVARAAIEALGGQLEVASEPGERGARFALYLPTVFEHVGKTSTNPPPPEGARSRVLLVDHDPCALTAMRRVLARDYEVTMITDPRDALRALTGGETFDMVVCELASAQLDGSELYRRVTATRPELAASFVFVTVGDPPAPLAVFLDNLTNERVPGPLTSSTLLDLAKRHAPVI